MALYRCANCGSPNVIKDQQVGGISYNYVKGAIGTAVLGTGGAVAGIQNKNQTVYKCPDCGLTLSAPMQPEIHTMIDIGVSDADARESLSLYGLPYRWEFLKEKYKNIEDGPAEKMIALKKEMLQNRVDFIAEMVVREIDALQMDQLAYEKGAVDYDELHNAWELATKAIMDQRQQALDEAYGILEQKYQNTTAQLEAGLESTKRQSDERNNRLVEEKDRLSQKLSTLGLFKMGEKKQTQTQIDLIEIKLKNNAEQSTLQIEQLEKKISDEREAYEREKTRIASEVENRFLLQADPGKRKAEIVAWRNDKAHLQGLVEKSIRWNKEPTEVAMFYVFKTMQNLSGGKTICLDTEWELETNWETGVIWIEDFKKICRVVVPKLLTYAGVDPNTVDMSGELRYVEVMRGTRNLIEKKRIIRVIREGAIRYYIE